MKAIYYGGSFNPFHLGHLEIVDALCDQLDVGGEEYDGLVIDPILEHRYLEKHFLPFKDRRDIIKASIEGRRHVYVSPFPASETNGSTYEAISYFQDRNLLPLDNVSIVIGADNAQDIKRWYKWEELVKKHEFIIFQRDGIEFDESLFHQYKTISFNNPVSSTNIRKMVEVGNWEYIRENMTEKSFERYLTLMSR